MSRRLVSLSLFRFLLRGRVRVAATGERVDETGGVSSRRGRDDVILGLAEARDRAHLFSSLTFAGFSSSRGGSNCGSGDGLGVFAHMNIVFESFSRFSRLNRTSSLKIVRRCSRK